MIDIVSIHHFDEFAGRYARQTFRHGWQREWRRNGDNASIQGVTGGVRGCIRSSVVDGCILDDRSRVRDDKGWGDSSVSCVDLATDDYPYRPRDLQRLGGSTIKHDVVGWYTIDEVML